MKRKYFSALLMGALTIASVSTFTSCKDYDDDISNLQQQIDTNAKAIETIQNLIKGGGVITGTESSSDGVVVTLSNGKSFNIKNGVNGKDGAPGTAWTIGDDGYWYKDGTKTDNLARGPQGEKGDQGETGPAGPAGAPGADASATSYTYYVPNAETGYFDIYKDGKKVEQSEIKFVSEVPNSITASLDDNNLILTGVKGISGEKVVISLTGDLTGLVFMPNLYLDGIETLTYDYLHGEYLEHKDNLTGLSRLNTTTGVAKTIKGLDNYLPDRLADATALDPAAAVLYNYGPAWGVKYHMNPSNADMAYEDITGFNLLEPTILNYHTRATASDLGNITSPKLNDAGKALFNTSNGIVTAGLKIQHPEKLEPFPTVKDKNETANTVALQAKTAASTVAEGKVTSDYALIQPQKAYLEALYWRLKPHYAGLGASNTRMGDEKGIPTAKYFGTTATDAAAQVHVYDSPQEALADPAGAALELYYNSAEGIDIASYLGLHMLVEDVKQFTPGTPNKLGVNLKELSLEEGKEWGLTYQFNLVNYQVDGNATIDSKYAKWVNQDAGVLRAWNVDKDGNPTTTESSTAIDREPLVQVLVKRGDKVVLDGYILIHITRQNPEVAPNKTIDLLTQDAQFDLCNDIDKLKTTWSQFSSIVLTQGLENMTKKDFDEQYTIDSKGNYGNDAAGNTTLDLRMFKDAPEKGGTYNAADDLGNIEYFPNTEGTTNHAFKWHLTAKELEKLTHDQANPVPVVRYVRYIGNAKAKYPYIYVKLTYNLSRANNNQTFGELIPEYWKGLDGSENGKDAVIFDVQEPKDGGDILGISRKVTSTLKGNVAKLVGTHKYYFVPEPVVVGDYTITPQKDASDTEWNKLICKYITGDSHVFSKAKLQETLESCAIKYAEGAFKNDKLYAVKKGTTLHVLIATLDRATSEITLVKNETTKAVLNAIGYEPANANIQKELRSWVGVVTENSCGVAEFVKDGIFLTSWERPINLIDVATEPRIDANTNGNVIYALDLFKLYDWRGWNTETMSEAGCVANQSNMWGDHLWFWGYYNVKSITIDTTPANVETTLGGGTWTTMDQISKDVELLCGNKNGNPTAAKKKGSETYTFNLTSYNSASQNAALAALMEADKAKFGTIWYYNNGGNVETFKVRIPITIAYEWGEFTTKVEFTINGTIGD